MSEKELKELYAAREITSADELSPDELSAIKNYLETANMRAQNFLIQYMENSLGIKIKIGESGLSDSFQRGQVSESMKAEVIKGITARIQKELGQINYPR